MTLTRRRTKGSQLTSAEADANLDHLELSSNHTFTQSGSGATATTVQGELRRSYWAEQFGAVGDGTTNDVSAIQTAHDAIVTAGGGILRLRGGITYKCNSGLTWNASKVSLSADGATLDFSSQTSGIALSVSNGGRNVDLGGVKLLGNSSSGSVIGMKVFGSDAASTARDLKLSNALIDTFGTGLQIGDRAYLLTFENVRIRNATTTVEYTGATDAGENIRFLNCLLECDVSGGTIFKTDASAGNLDAYLIGCSIDSSQTSFTAFSLTNSNKVFMIGGHIEAADFASTAITIVGVATNFTMIGGNINSAAATLTANHFISIDGTVQNYTGGAIFDNVHFNFTTTGSGSFATGVGAANCVLINLRGTPTFTLPSGWNVDFGRVYFPATQRTSSNVNCLDDYEESSWTPTDASGAGLTFASATGTATKVGRLVNFEFEITFPTTANGAAVTIGSLPYTSVASGPTNPIKGYMAFSDYTTAPIQLVGGQNATTVALYRAGNTAMVNSDLSGKLIRMFGQYLTAT